MSPVFGLLPVDATYEVRAGACPHLLCRILGLFAQQELLPTSVRMRRDAENVVITVIQGSVAQDRAAIVARKIETMVMVRSVSMECRIGSQQPGA